MGSLYRSQHELILVFKNGTAPHLNNVELGRHGRNRTNLWRYPGANALRAGGLEELRLHPTVKPVQLVVDLLLDASRRRGVVLDPFLGSGTTLIAAERTGRRAYAMELEPRYVDVAIRRWQEHTGGQAILAGSGCRFATVAEDRDQPTESADHTHEAPAHGRLTMRWATAGRPRHSRFRKGQSGNPTGRSKGTKDLATDLKEELAERILVREGNSAKRLSKQRAVLKRLFDKSLKGEVGALRILLDLLVRLADGGAAEPSPAPLTKEERELLADLEARLRRRATPAGAIDGATTGDGSEGEET